MHEAQTAVLPHGAVEDFDRLAERFVGVRLSQTRLHEREAALAKLVREAGMSSWDALRAMLATEGGRHLVERLAGEFTVKETYFFRSPAQFDALLDLALPDARREAMHERPVRIWCAGCATGEEAYSIAMAAAVGIGGADPGVQVLATDLGDAALAKARAARYPSNVVRNLPERYERILRGHVEQFADGVLAPRPDVRRCVTFARHNLLMDAVPLACDIVFCRNVMVYFPVAHQPLLVSRLRQALRPGGWLFLGDAELLHVMPHDFERVLLDGGVAYRRARDETACAGRLVS